MIPEGAFRHFFRRFCAHHPLKVNVSFSFRQFLIGQYLARRRLFRPVGNRHRTQRIYQCAHLTGQVGMVRTERHMELDFPSFDSRREFAAKFFAELATVHLHPRQSIVFLFWISTKQDVAATIP